MHSKLYIPARSATLPFTVDVTPESAGWTESSRCRWSSWIRPPELALNTGDTEVMILPLAGGGTVECDGESSNCRRARRFSTALPTWSTSASTRRLRPGRRRTHSPSAARARSESFPNRRVAAADVSVELRGAGNCSRQVHNFGTAGVFEADSLIACEVITPGGNWSSYPAHKHDENTPSRIAARGDLLLRDRLQAQDESRGFGYHRVYGTPERPIEVLEEVRTGDVVLVPHGYHGPSVAAPGYHMYYLNVMAGPGDERAWKIVDDPEHAWLRGTWEDQDIDPRLPLHVHEECDRGLHGIQSSKTPDDRTDGAAHRGAGHHSVPCQPVRRTRRRTHQVLRRLLRHLRPRQRGRHRPGAAAGRDRRDASRQSLLDMCWAATSRRWCTPLSAYARQKDRLQAWAVTASIGPGSTNMLTGAALATINRLPVLLLAIGHLRHPRQRAGVAGTRTAVMTVRSPSTTRSNRCPAFLTGYGAPNSCPRRFSVRCACSPTPSKQGQRRWPSLRTCRPRRTTGRNPCSPNAPGTSQGRFRSDPSSPGAAEVIRSAQRPLIVAGGGVIYSGATDALAAFAERTGIPVSETQAGKGSLPYDHPQSVGAVGSTGTTAANALAAEADVVIGIGTRYSDFTSASRTAFNDQGVRFVNINVASFDAVKQGGLSAVADAREAIEALTAALTELLGEQRISHPGNRARQGVGRHRFGRVPSRRRRRQPQPEPGDRADEHPVRAARCGGVRGRIDAGRPAQDVAYPRPQGLSRRIRLLVHGLRGGRRHRRQDGRAPTATSSSWSATGRT